MISARFSPQARRDLTGAVGWIANDNPAAARALRDAIRKAADQIGTHPRCGALRPEIVDEPYRFISLTGFPYVLVYNPELNPPLILRVLHGARDLPELFRL